MRVRTRPSSTRSRPCRRSPRNRCPVAADHPALAGGVRQTGSAGRPDRTLRFGGRTRRLRGDRRLDTHTSVIFDRQDLRIRGNSERSLPPVAETSMRVRIARSRNPREIRVKPFELPASSSLPLPHPCTLLRHRTVEVQDRLAPGPVFAPPNSPSIQPSRHSPTVQVNPRGAAAPASARPGPAVSSARMRRWPTHTQKPTDRQHGSDDALGVLPGCGWTEGGERGKDPVHRHGMARETAAESQPRAKAFWSKAVEKRTQFSSADELRPPTPRVAHQYEPRPSRRRRMASWRSCARSWLCFSVCTSASTVASAAARARAVGCRKISTIGTGRPSSPPNARSPESASANERRRRRSSRSHQRHGRPAPASRRGWRARGRSRVSGARPPTVPHSATPAQSDRSSRSTSTASSPAGRWRSEPCTPAAVSAHIGAAPSRDHSLPRRDQVRLQRQLLIRAAGRPWPVARHR